MRLRANERLMQLWCGMWDLACRALNGLPAGGAHPAEDLRPQAGT